MSFIELSEPKVLYIEFLQYRPLKYRSLYPNLNDIPTYEEVLLHAGRSWLHCFLQL